MARIVSSQKIKMKSRKAAYKHEKTLAKMRNKGRAAGAKAIGKSVVESISAITAPISATEMSEHSTNAKIAETNAKYNNQNYQKALDTWMDQMSGNPSSDGDKGSSGSKQTGSTTDQSRLGG